MGEERITDRSEGIRVLNEKIKDVRFAMLTTITPEGEPYSRPMATQEAEFDGELWFFTEGTSAKARHIQTNPQVNLGYADPDKNTWISVTGPADIVRDRAKIDELWNPVLKTFFPDGKDDPNLVLLRVQPEHAEIWDGPSSAIGQAVQFAKSFVTGGKEPPGDDVKVDLTR